MSFASDEQVQGIITVLKAREDLHKRSRQLCNMKLSIPVNHKHINRNRSGREAAKRFGREYQL